MSTDGVEVKIGADTGDATSGVKDAQSQIAAALQGIQTALENFGAKNKAVTKEAVENNANLSRSFIEMKESVSKGFEGIVGVVERFRGVMVGLAAVVAGGAIFRESVNSVLELEQSVRLLEQTFGKTTEEATELAINLKLAGVSADAFSAMALKVGRQLKEPNSELDRLGVKTKDATGNFLPMEDILQNVYQRMQDFKAGTDQTEFALATVGRSSAQFAIEMERVNRTQATAAKLVHDLNIELDESRVEDYKVSMASFGVVMDHLSELIGEAVMPSLQGMADWFTTVGPSAANVVVTAIKVVMTVFTALGSTIGIAAVEVSTFFQEMAARAIEAAQITKAVATGQWGSIAGIVAQANAKVEALEKEASQAVVDTWQQATDKIKKLWDETAQYDQTMGPPAPKKQGKERFTAKPGGGGGGVMEELKAKLQAEQDAYDNEKTMQGSFEQWSLQMTMNYWANVLATVKLSAKDRLSAQSEYYRADRALMQQAYASYIAGLEEQKDALANNIQAKIALTKQELQAAVQHYGAMSAEAAKYYKEISKLEQDQIKQNQALAKDAEKFQIDLYTQELAGEQAALNQQVALRKVSADQVFAIEKQMEDRIYALKLKEMQDELALLQQGTLAYQQQAEKIELIEVQHQQKLTAIDNAAELERKQAALQADQAMENSFAGFINDMESGTKSFKQAFQDMIKSLTNSLNQLAANQIAKQLFGAGSSGGGAVDSLMQKIFGGGSGAGGAAAGGGAQGNAAAMQADTVAVQGQTAAVTAQTPLITTLNTAFTTLTAACQQAAQALMQVGASGGLGGGGGGFDPLNMLTGIGIPSFDVGTPYVPQDTLAMVHKGETIIPAGMGGGGGGNRSVSVTNHFHVGPATDTRTQTQIAAAAYNSIRRGAARNL